MTPTQLPALTPAGFAVAVARTAARYGLTHYRADHDEFGYDARYQLASGIWRTFDPRRTGKAALARLEVVLKTDLFYGLLPTATA